MAGTTESPCVVEDIRLDCVDQSGRRRQLPATLCYSADDPYAVTLTFYTSAGEVPWVFGRELLMSGSQEPAGHGDVSVWPTLDASGYPVVIFELDSFGVCVIAQANARDIDRFVGRSLALVPFGAEADRLDIDGMIDRLLLAS